MRGEKNQPAEPKNPTNQTKRNEQKPNQSYSHQSHSAKWDVLEKPGQGTIKRIQTALLTSDLLPNFSPDPLLNFHHPGPEPFTVWAHG